MQRALTGAHQGTTDIDKAVGNYLKLVSGSAAGVASQIDADIAAIIAAADAVSAKMPKQDPKARPSRDPKIAQGEALAKALVRLLCTPSMADSDHTSHRLPTRRTRPP